MQRLERGVDLSRDLLIGHGRAAHNALLQIGSGVTAPVEIRRATPQYTTAAMQARVQGAVIVECVVQTNGICSNMRVIRSLDPKNIEGIEWQQKKDASYIYQ